MYRDDRQAARLQLPHVAVAEAPVTLRRLRELRLGWIAAGLTGIAGAALFTIAIPVTWDDAIGRPALPLLLLGCWPAAALVGLATALLARLTRPRPHVEGSDALTTLAVRHADREHGSLRRGIARLGFASVALPLLACCLLAPLTIHVLIILAFPGGTLEVAGGWIGASAIVTWLPHVVVCYTAIKHCRQLREGVSRSVWVALAHLGLATAAVVPCSMFVGLTPYAIRPHGEIDIVFNAIVVVTVAAPVVFITGVAFLPAAYGWTRRRIEREHTRLAA